jgi:hypothetical protein
MLRKAVKGLPGLISIPVFPRAPSHGIVDLAHRRVAGYYVNAHNLPDRADSVRVWHERFFGAPPTIVLEVHDHRLGTPASEYAGWSYAARRLAGEGFRVIVDASDQGVPPDAYVWEGMTTTVEEMPREMLESIPELQSLHAALKEAGLDDFTWAALGGVPASYMRLWVRFRCPDSRTVGKEESAIAAAVKEEVSYQLRENMSMIIRAVCKNPALKEILHQFNEQNEGGRKEFVTASDFERQGLPWLAAEGILRWKVLPADTATSSSRKVLVPSLPAIRLALRFHVNYRLPSFENMQKAIAADKARETANAAAITAFTDGAGGLKADAGAGVAPIKELK